MNAEDPSLVGILLTKPVPRLLKRDIWKIMSSKKLDTPCMQAFTLDLQDATGCYFIIPSKCFHFRFVATK